MNYWLQLRPSILNMAYMYQEWVTGLSADPIEILTVILIGIIFVVQSNKKDNYVIRQYYYLDLMWNTRRIWIWVSVCVFKNMCSKLMEVYNLVVFHYILNSIVLNEFTTVKIKLVLSFFIHKSIGTSWFLKIMQQVRIIFHTIGSHCTRISGN